MSRKRDEITESDNHNARGIELADRGWLDEAAKEFKKAIKLDPQSAHAHDNLGTILADQGNLLDALREFMAAMEADAESPTVHHYLASFLATHGVDLAVAEYRKAIELDYEFPDAHLNLAMAMADRGQIEEAILELEIAHQQAPEDEVIEHELASCLIDAERYLDAITHLRKIIKTHPEHVEAYVDLGVAYTAQGFLAEAEAILLKALELDEDDFSAHYQIAALYAAWDRNPDALDHLDKAAAQDEEKARQWLRDDRMFEPLRNEERFARFV